MDYRLGSQVTTGWCPGSTFGLEFLPIAEGKSQLRWCTWMEYRMAPNSRHRNRPGTRLPDDHAWDVLEIYRFFHCPEFSWNSSPFGIFKSNRRLYSLERSPGFWV